MYNRGNIKATMVTTEAPRGIRHSSIAGQAGGADSSLHDNSFAYWSSIYPNEIIRGPDGEIYRRRHSGHTNEVASQPQSGSPPAIHTVEKLGGRRGKHHFEWSCGCTLEIDSYDNHTLSPCGSMDCVREPEAGDE